MKAIKKNLRDSILNNSWKKVIMKCFYCGGVYSANSGDYWNLPDNHEFECCGEVMELVIPKIKYEEIRG